MSLLFWRKTQDTGEYRPDGTAQSKDVVATVTDPIPVQIIQPDDNDYPRYIADQGAAGAVGWPTTPSSKRNAGVLHRNAITAVDKITDFVAADMTVATVAGTQGSLLLNTLYYLSVIPGNRWGPTKSAAAIDSVTTQNDAVNTHVVDLTIAQATGADWYEVFLSTDTAPKLVGRITEAQRASGGFEILTMGTVTANAGVAAGHLYVGVLGTGIQTSNAVFAQNNAYRPATVTAINCTGSTKAHIKVKVALTDLRTAPELAIIPFFSNQVSTADYEHGDVTPVPLLTALGQALEQELVLDVDGSTGLAILIDTIAGQGAAVSIWCELV